MKTSTTYGADELAKTLIKKIKIPAMEKAGPF